MARRKQNRIKLTTGDKVYQAVICVVVGLVALSCVLPLLYVLGGSFTSYREVLERGGFFFIPFRPTTNMYKYLRYMGAPDLFFCIPVTLARCVLGPLTMLALTVPGGYMLAKRELPGRKYLVFFFALTMVASGGIIPDYIIREQLGLLDTFWVYIIPTMGVTLNMLIIKIFVERIPGEIMESADIDGASELRKLWHIALPLLVPVLCTLGLFSFIEHWNDWFTTTVYVKDYTLYPVQYIIRKIMGIMTIQGGYPQNEGPYAESIKMAAVVVSALPILILYPFLHKHLIHGIYTGAVKE